MISLEIKADTKSSGVVKDTKNEKAPVLSFAELLNGIEKEENTAVVKTPNMLLVPQDEKASKQQSLGKDEIKDTKGSVQKSSVLKLLQGIEAEIAQTKNVSSSQNVDEKEQDVLKAPFSLNEKITTLLTPKEVKNLISDAKEYLKNQITQTKEYKQSQINDLPKTLKGLATLAKKLDIDVSKITIEKVETSVKEPKLDLKNLQRISIQEQNSSDDTQKKVLAHGKESKNDLKDLLSVKKEAIEVKEPKNNPQDLSDVKKETVQLKESKSDPKDLSGVKKEIKQEQPKEADKKITAEKQTSNIDKTKEIEVEKSDIKTSQNGKNEVEVPKQQKIVSQDDLQTKQKEIIKPVITQTTKSVSIEKNKQTDELDLKNVQKTQQVSQVIQEIKTAPILKQTQISSISTQEIVSKKISKPEVKNTKEKADDTLQLLLKGESVRKNDTALTADFSVATAKVIAPRLNDENKKGLKELLQGDSAQKSESVSRPEQAQVAKSDSLDVKINEAKQMIKYLSNDVKDAIDNYKSPFTRVKVQLNPQKLGEVDLTVVQRGKNLHVNLSSNNAAINTLAMNANDLKTQLQNSGINNATLNFNNQGEGSQQQQGQQQNKEQARQQYENFQQLDNEDENKEHLSSLEIIVPRYI